MQNPYSRFIAIPYKGDNLFALLDEVPIHTTKREAMAAAETTTETEQERIERWRADELERAGYEPRAAGRLAVRHDVDLHRATELLQRGCSQELALKILL